MIYLTTALAIALTVTLGLLLREREWSRILALHLNARTKHVTTALPLVRRRSWTRMFTQGEDLPSFALPRDIR